MMHEQTGLIPARPGKQAAGVHSEVHHLPMTCVLYPEAGFDHGEPCLHEHHEEPRAQGPGEVDPILS